jgi:molybdopterin-guanine dinucleotide biosynthesis protein A
MESKIAGIILAGGKNTRMHGEDKAFIEIEGKTIVARIIEKLKPLVCRIIVVTNSPEKYVSFKVKAIKDEHPGKGPLMGIYCGLKASSSKYNFVTACDMPFINASLIKFIIDSRDNYDIVISRVSEKFHTLFGLYSKSCIPVMEEMLGKNELRLRSIFPKLNARFLSRQEIEKIDPSQLSLVNINTPEELTGIKRLRLETDKK